MLDLSRFQDKKTAPQVVFDALPQLSTRPRFMVPSTDGDYRSVTWGAFADQIREIGSYLLSLGCGTGDRSAIYAPNRVEWMSAALAIQGAGGVMVPIYPASTGPQAGYIVEHSDARVVFVDSAPLLRRLLGTWKDLGRVERVVMLGELDPEKELATLRDEGTPVPSLGDVLHRLQSLDEARRIGAAWEAEHPGAFERTMRSLRPSDGAVMLYTSGTTGNPKGVPLSHGNVMANGDDWLSCNAPLLEEGFIDLLWLPMSHIFGFGEACIGNLLGFVSYLCEPHNVLDALPRVRPNVFMSVPAYWEKIAGQVASFSSKDERRRRLSEVTGGKLKFCLSGGAGLKREVKELFYESGLLIIEGYGLTECSPTLTLNRPSEFRFDSVGKVLPSVELRLAEDGEILARGPSIFSGYHKDPEATAQAFTEDGWFKTGDVGRFTEDRFLQIVDRKKEILVTAGGKNVPPANIELRFATDQHIEHAVVFGDGRKFLVLGIWLNHEAVDKARSGDGEGSDRGEFVAKLVADAVARVNRELASFEQIKRYRIMDTPLTVASGLLTSTLKVRRKKVYEVFAREFEALYEGTT